MKKLVVILIALFAFGCDQEDNEPQKSSMTCKFNDAEWTGKPMGGMRDNYFGIGFTKMKKIDGVEVRWQSLSFDILKRKQGLQRLYKRTQLVTTNPDSAKTCASFSTTQDDGDAICDIYELIEADSLTNFIRITKETGNYKEVWGEFSVNFVRTRGCTESTLPDTLRIRDGQFHVVLE